MADTDARLDAKANAIAAFFAPYPEAEAVAGVKEHVAAFWTPGMRRALLARMAAGEARLDPVVVLAMRPGEPAAESPAHREAAGPAELGQLGASDAG